VYSIGFIERTTLVPMRPKERDWGWRFASGLLRFIMEPLSYRVPFTVDRVLRFSFRWLQYLPDVFSHLALSSIKKF
jgi:hypothetical protein